LVALIREEHSSGLTQEPMGVPLAVRPLERLVRRQKQRHENDIVVPAIQFARANPPAFDFKTKFSIETTRGHITRIDLQLEFLDTTSPTQSNISFQQSRTQAAASHLRAEAHAKFGRMAKSFALTAPYIAPTDNR